MLWILQQPSPHLCLVAFQPRCAGLNPKKVLLTGQCRAVQPKATDGFPWQMQGEMHLGLILGGIQLGRNNLQVASSCILNDPVRLPFASNPSSYPGLVDDVLVPVAVGGHAVVFRLWWVGRVGHIGWVTSPCVVLRNPSFSRDGSPVFPIPSQW